MKVLLDTHLWIWWLLGSERLPPPERHALDRLAGAGGCHLSAMSLWGAQMLHAKGRISLGRPFETWLGRLPPQGLWRCLRWMSEWWWQWITCRRAFMAILPTG